MANCRVETGVPSTCMPAASQVDSSRALTFTHHVPAALTSITSPLRTAPADCQSALAATASLVGWKSTTGRPKSAARAAVVISSIVLACFALPDLVACCAAALRSARYSACAFRTADSYRARAASGDFTGGAGADADADGGAVVGGAAVAVNEMSAATIVTVAIVRNTDPPARKGGR